MLHILTEIIRWTGGAGLALLVLWLCGTLGAKQVHDRHVQLESQRANKGMPPPVRSKVKQPAYDSTYDGSEYPLPVKNGNGNGNGHHSSFDIPFN